VADDEAVDMAATVLLDRKDLGEEKLAAKRRNGLI
jgi:hypothetical protein